MKKTLWIVAIMVLAAALAAQTGTGDKPKKLNIRTAYTYQAESLLVSLSDLYCSFMISPGMDDSIRIIGAEHQDLDRTIFTMGDRLYINKGAEVGIKKGDRFHVVSQGGKVPDPFSVGSLGVYFRFRGQALVTCVFSERAIIELVNTCSPAEIGHFLVPFKKQEHIYRRGVNYLDCKIPDTGVSGRVVYLDIEQDVPREIAFRSNMVAVNIGLDKINRGDLVLFYKFVRKDLPPVIVGTGIVVHPGNANSTVKILDGGYPVEVGTYVMLMPESDAPQTAGGQEIPIIEKLKDEGQTGAETATPVDEFSADLLFALGSAELSDAVRAKLEEAAEFLEGKKEYIIALKGYTCSIGNETQNLKLSQQRVDAVKAFMKAGLEIGDEFFDTHFYGESEAAFDNSVEAQRRLNRRVSLKIMAR